MPLQLGEWKPEGQEPGGAKTEAESHKLQKLKAAKRKERHSLRVAFLYHLITCWPLASERYGRRFSAVPDSDFSGWFVLFGTHPCLRIASSAETLAGYLLFLGLTESNPAAVTSLAPIT